MSLAYGSDAETQFGEVMSILSKRGIVLDHMVRGDAAAHDRRLLVVANGLDTADVDEAAVYANIVNHLDDVSTAALRNIIEAERDAFLFGTTKQRPGLAYMWMKDLGIAGNKIPTAIADYAYDESLTDGTVAILHRLGIIGAVRGDMELAANDQYITANGVTFGTFTAESGNQGTLAVTTMTGESHVPSCTMRLRCTNNSATRPEFEVWMSMTEAQRLWTGEDVIRGRRPLVAEKDWEDGWTGLSLKFTRSGLAAPTVTDTDALFSSESVATPHDGDSNLGKFYLRVTRQANAPIWLIECFSDAAYTTKTGRVTTAAGAGNVSLTLTCNNGSVLSFDFQRTTAASAMASTGDTSVGNIIDIVNPRQDDEWYRTCTNDAAGNFATLMMKLGIRMSLPVSGTNLWTDSLAAPYTLS